MSQSLQFTKIKKNAKKYHVKPKTYQQVYGMHKYWAKKPYNLINNLINKYSKKNEIVLDPFCGSGISLIESLLSDRKTIGIDINPASIAIANEILIKNGISKIKAEFEKIQNNCKDKISSLYEIKRNKQIRIGTHFVWSNGKLIEIWSFEKKWFRLKPKQSDERFAKSFTYSKIRYFYPKDKLFDHPRINSHSKMRVCDLFTTRNTYALSILLNRINKIKDRKVKDFFRFCFSSALGQSSKMVFVINNQLLKNGKKKPLKRRQVGSWVIGYWIPKEHFEINVWNCFLRRYKKIIKAKIEQQSGIFNPKFVKNFAELKKGNILLIKNSAFNALKKIPSNSIDYIITDPPHGDRIPYLELSLMWNSWLQNKVNYENEIVISQAKGRGKDRQDYHKLLGKTLKEAVRVLKPNKRLTLMFNNYDQRTWKELQNNIKEIGLKFDNASKIKYSHNSVVQENKDGGLKHDFLLTFKKKLVKSPKTV